MGFGDKAKAWADEHQFDSAFEDYMLSGDTIKRGFRTWPVAGAKADFEHGANVGGRVTLTRVALTGIFALALKKDRSKVYVLIELADGEQILAEGKAKHETQARRFAMQVNKAGAHYSA